MPDSQEIPSQSQPFYTAQLTGPEIFICDSHNDDTRNQNPPSTIDNPEFFLINASQSSKNDDDRNENFPMMDNPELFVINAAQLSENENIEENCSELWFDT